MSGFVVFKKLSIKDAIECMLWAEKFFRENTDRKLAVTSLFPIRRGHVVEDVWKHTKREEQTNDIHTKPNL